MHQDATWYEGRPWPRPHYVRWGHMPLPAKKGTHPQFSAHVYCVYHLILSNYSSKITQLNGISVSTNLPLSSQYARLRTEVNYSNCSGKSSGLGCPVS